jgi:hypothetical protein
MLLHFTGTNTNTVSYDKLVETENNPFEGVTAVFKERKKLFILNFSFRENSAEESHSDESVARESLKNKLSQLGYENAAELAEKFKFQSDEN